MCSECSKGGKNCSASRLPDSSRSLFFPRSDRLVPLETISSSKPMTKSYLAGREAVMDIIHQKNITIAKLKWLQFNDQVHEILLDLQRRVIIRTPWEALNVERPLTRQSVPLMLWSTAWAHWQPQTPPTKIAKPGNRHNKPLLGRRWMRTSSPIIYNTHLLPTNTPDLVKWLYKQWPDQFLPQKYRHQPMPGPDLDFHVQWMPLKWPGIISSSIISMFFVSVYLLMIYFTNTFRTPIGHRSGFAPGASLTPTYEENIYSTWRDTRNTLGQARQGNNPFHWDPWKSRAEYIK